MAKKPRSQRRGGGGGKKKGSDGKGGDDGGSNFGGGADFLSETHTIASLGGNSSVDDDTWGIDDHEDDDRWLLNSTIDPDDPNNIDSAAAASAVMDQQQQQLQDSLSQSVEFRSEKRSQKRLQMLKEWFTLISRHASPPMYESTIYKYLDEILAACSKTSLIRGTPQEQYAALRVLEVISVLVSSQPLLEELQPRLMKVITAASQRATPVRSVALRTLAMLVVCMDDGQDHADIMTCQQLLDTCEELIGVDTSNVDNNHQKEDQSYKYQYYNAGKQDSNDDDDDDDDDDNKNNNKPSTMTPPGLRATALHVWTFVASQCFHPSYISGGGGDGDDGADSSRGRGLALLPVLAQILSVGSGSSSSSSDETNNETSSLAAAVDTNSDGYRSLIEAAGLTVSYIHDLRLRLGATSVDDDDNDNVDGEIDGDEDDVTSGRRSSTTARKYAKGNWNNASPYYQDLMDELTQHLYQLAHQSGHHLSKARKKTQRSLFRDYWHCLQDDEPPTVETISFRGGTLELSTWKDIVAFHTFRRCFQGGLQHQMVHCPSVQNILGADGSTLNNVANSQYSQLEKRLLWSQSSAASKAKDLDLKKQRTKRRNIANHFLTVDE